MRIWSGYPKPFKHNPPPGPRPIYRYSTDRYHCPFCGFERRRPLAVREHMATCGHRREK